MTLRQSLAALGFALAIDARTSPARAADLSPTTLAAFERYVQATEQRIAAEVQSGDRFLWPDTLSTTERNLRLASLNRGELVIERLTTTRQGKAIDLPGGLVHHWLGVAFLPGVRIDRAVELLQDYDRHAAVYAPRVARSALRAHDGNTFRFHLRFLMKKVITVVIDSENLAEFSRPSPERAFSRIVSTRMAEIDDAGTPSEKEKPIGHDSGYLWRLNSYWRFAERDGGTYLQCESVSLTRGIPVGFGWLVGPFVTSLPRESLEFTLETTRRALAPH
ncbi:MAG TPA: hypothetical protein VM032_06475 [Vicinamibacterales bacterium]|nr:hypothetical protein [Vicinamibacterales bacterium]